MCVFGVPKCVYLNNISQQQLKKGGFLSHNLSPPVRYNEIRFSFFILYIFGKKIYKLYICCGVEGGGEEEVRKKKWRTLSGESLCIFCIDSHDNTMFQEYNMKMKKI